MIRRRRTTLGLIAAGAAAIVLAGSIVAANTEADVPMVGQPAPALAGPALTGDSAGLAEMRGKVVLVNMWASWCAPCAEEIPVLVEAQRRYASHGLQVLGVNTQDRPAAARRAAREWGADAYPNIVDEDGSIAVAWGVVGLPETYVVSRDGEILERHFGPVTRAWLDESIAPLVAP